METTTLQVAYKWAMEVAKDVCDVLTELLVVKIEATFHMHVWDRPDQHGES